MPDLSALAWTLMAFAALLVGISKTALPGSNTISVAIFAALLPAKESTGALLVLLIVGDAFAVWAYRKHADWQVLRRLVPTVVAGLVAGALFLALASDAGVRRVIGVILLLVIAMTLVRRYTTRKSGDRPISKRREHVQAGVYGTLGGFTTMVANAAGPVMSMYFLASRFSMKTFLGTAAWFYAVVNLVKVPFSVGLGLITEQTLLVNAVLVPAVVAGALAGRALVTKMNQTLFDRLIILLTVVGAVYLLF
ncbi:sulfite exporter TauE/SafE family protein [Ruania zhangjianzhongii]|uniref:sulfite exporter TauE/SafE family protein n=1 Tax=Ruania zhangjianzhongii TaxID=2603206 RepID=UPI001651D0C0|nr:sulfite exporter TauE/SafE family protein [Ruania zhangjianzhongii]